MFAVYIERRTYTPLQNFKNTFIDHSTYSTSFTRKFYTKLYCLCSQQFTFEPYITRITVYKALSECLLIIFFLIKMIVILCKKCLYKTPVYHVYNALFYCSIISHFVRVLNSCAFLEYVRKTGFTFYF